MPTTMKHFGWKPDIPDRRDRRWSRPGSTRPTARLPRVDLSSRVLWIRDQGMTGSCVGNSTAAAVDITRGTYRHSARFAYYAAREQDGFQDTDDGAYIRSSFKALGQGGIPVESKFKFAERLINKAPTASVRQAAEHWRGEYVRCDSLDDMQAALTAGHPVVFGFAVYANIGEADLTGILPAHVEGQLLGGHAVCAVGYDVASSRVKFQNSWGESWGEKGFGYMPFGYFAQWGEIVDDAWALVREA